MRALALLVVLAVAGCGGGDSLSRAEWAERANAICRDTLEKVEALGQPVTSADFLRLMPKANELGRKAVAGLRELEPPEEIV